MRAIALALTLITGAVPLAAHAPQAPQAPQPVFRAGVELVLVDVTALDSTGRQVTDLKAADFEVEIDGQKRQVATAEYIRSVDPLRVIGAPAKVVVAAEP